MDLTTADAKAVPRRLLLLPLTAVELRQTQMTVGRLAEVRGDDRCGGGGASTAKVQTLRLPVLLFPALTCQVARDHGEDVYCSMSVSVCLSSDKYGLARISIASSKRLQLARNLNLIISIMSTTHSRV